MAQMLELSLRDFKVMIMKDLEKNVDNMCGQMREISSENWKQ